MKKSIFEPLQWSVRILGMLFALFLTVFASDAFQEREQGLSSFLINLSMHLIWPLLVAAIVIVSWKKVWIGGTAYLLLGLLYVAVSIGRIEWTGILAMSGPLFLASALGFWALYASKRPRQ